MEIWDLQVTIVWQGQGSLSPPQVADKCRAAQKIKNQPLSGIK